MALMLLFGELIWVKTFLSLGVLDLILRTLLQVRMNIGKFKHLLIILAIFHREWK